MGPAGSQAGETPLAESGFDGTSPGGFQKPRPRGEVSLALQQRLQWFVV